MKSVTIYTTPFCGYCFAAKRLLAAKGVAFEEIDVARRARAARPRWSSARGARARSRRSSSAATASAASTSIAALDRAGKLDPLLADG